MASCWYCPCAREFQWNVKGDGSFEWNGYLPIIEKPSAYNPSSGFIATANQNVTPENYPHYNAIGYSWSDPYRGDRIDKVLNDNKNFSISDSNS